MYNLPILSLTIITPSHHHKKSKINKTNIFYQFTWPVENCVLVKNETINNYVGDITITLSWRLSYYLSDQSVKQNHLN